ncbi:PD-(D/E)XK nuclease family transposase [Tunicatimonas pelagia]|uniref:PD-(D/E)XK nuclease family transposase n=1 Tax=Tunicatimonas pelagia TaxID=931531 RepID=UPI002666A57A|nr:PD-(D/E)XK nuclease family transposase [Tunicatimonas pelagia]WKN42858.1 PD-(D/E)XK nuclease family transposase [Tunicatimonas pelagia]
MAKKLVRFDWAIKKLLRHKANFTILEGFLTELLKFEVTIESILEGEGNKEEVNDKYNRVDILVKSVTGELMLVEVQNESQVDYFQRMVYGASKLITEYIKEGEPYGAIKKVYSINIVYFGLGQGKDYIYEYDGKFVGIHYGDILQPTLTQKDTFHVKEIKDIFPKYYVLKVNNFDDVAKNTLDEWVYFLKNSEVKDDFRARGLKEVKEKLKEDTLTEEELIAYKRFQENRRIERSEIETALIEGEEKGMEKGMGIVIKVYQMHKEGGKASEIAEIVSMPVAEVEEIIKNFT